MAHGLARCSWQSRIRIHSIHQLDMDSYAFKRVCMSRLQAANMYAYMNRQAIKVQFQLEQGKIATFAPKLEQGKVRTNNKG